MGSAFGIISLILALIDLLGGIFILMAFSPPFNFIFIIMTCIVAIVFGIVGIVRDDAKGLGIAGLILGIIALVIWGIFGLILLTLILILFPFLALESLF